MARGEGAGLSGAPHGRQRPENQPLDKFVLELAAKFWQEGSAH